MNPLLTILLGVVATGIAAYCLGRIALVSLKLFRGASQDQVAALLVGAVALSGVMFLLCLLQLASVWAAVGLLGLSLFTCFWMHPPRLAAPAPSRAQLGAILRRPLLLLMGVLLCAFAGRYLLHAFAPDIAFDSAYYHLGFIRQYAEHGGFVYLTDNLYAALSQGAELIFLYAYLLGGDSSPAVVHTLFVFLAAAIAYHLVRPESDAASATACALIVVATPVVGMAGVVAYVDAVVLAVVLGSLWLLERWRRERDTSWLFLAGLVAGFAYAVKYTAFLALFIAVAYVLWESRRELRRLPLRLAGLGCGAALMVSPWVLRNWILFDNPFAPFLNRYFPNPFFFPYAEQSYRAKLQTYDWLQSYWQLPREWFVGGMHLQGVIGFGFLAAPLALLALRSRLGRWALIAALAFLAIYPSNVGVRFLIPVLGFLAVALATALKKDPAVFVVIALIHGFTSWPRVLDRLVDQGAWILQRTPHWEEIATEDGRERLRQLRSPEYRMAKLVDEVVKNDGRILGYAAFAEGYSSRHLCLEFTSATCSLAGEVLLSGTIPGRMPTVHDRVSFASLQAPAIRVVLTNAVANQRWAINELRLYADGQEIPRDSAWKLSSSHEPWFLPRAFDNSPATNWSAWSQSQPGTYVEIDFGRILSLDTIELQFPMDWYFPQYRVEVRNPQGAWQPVESTTERKEIQDPTFPREASLALLRAGFRYILAYYSDFHFSWLMRDRDVMGLEIAGSNEDGVIFRIRDPE